MLVLAIAHAANALAAIATYKIQPHAACLLLLIVATDSYTILLHIIGCC